MRPQGDLFVPIQLGLKACLLVPFVWSGFVLPTVLQRLLTSPLGHSDLVTALVIPTEHFLSLEFVVDARQADDLERTGFLYSIVWDPEPLRKITSGALDRAREHLLVFGGHLNLYESHAVNVPGFLFVGVNDCGRRRAS